MSDIVIRAENLGKRYLLNHQSGGTGYRRFSESILHAATAPLRWLQRQPSDASHGTTEEFWALKDISFDVKQGEVIGVIGRNGAGKSTLLKVLSRITEPTTGRITLRGRVASLLEVGTGFHPELTGRENIYLNGAILGMAKAEIRAKFDEIVAFAEIERFLDTPVKRYSSGMYVRLAFAVAAHLEPEILIIDEVLAVGDAQFQKKCLGKMQDVAAGGRTVLFVSHNMPAVQRLCTKGIVLNRGQVETQGDIATCIDTYLRQPGTQANALRSDDLALRSQGRSDLFRFHSLACVDAHGSPLSHLKLRQPFSLAVTFEVHEPIHDLIVGFAVHTDDNTPLLASHNNDFGQLWSLTPGQYTVTIPFTPNYLRPKRYTISLGALGQGTLLSHLHDALSLTVENVSNDTSDHTDDRIGALFIPMQWTPPQRI